MVIPNTAYDAVSQHPIQGVAEVAILRQSSEPYVFPNALTLLLLAHEERETCCCFINLGVVLFLQVFNDLLVGSAIDRHG